MPGTASALSSLLPLAGAIALIYQGVARTRARRASGRHTYTPPPQPKEIPDAAPRRHVKVVPDTTCAHCGTSIPGRDTLCAPCDRALAREPRATRATVLSWLAFAAIMGAAIGAGVLLSP
jgi:predicted nucleic acid-binding Zn ribbon protein